MYIYEISQLCLYYLYPTYHAETAEHNIITANSLKNLYKNLMKNFFLFLHLI